MAHRPESAVVGASSPQKTHISGSSKVKLPVIVVGAGVAGKLLKAKYNIDVVVVEASKFVGGRVRQERLWNRDWDLGAEFIHGTNSILKAAIDRMQLKHQFVFNLNERDPTKPINVFFYLGRERRLVGADTKDKDITRMIALLEAKEVPRGDDLSMLRHLVNNDIPLRAIGLADALYAKSSGTDINLVGIQEFIRESQRWAARNYGEENLRLDDSFKPLIAELGKDLTIKTDWQVREINFEDVGSIKITNQSGEVLEGTRVIITVPLTVLRDKDIKFTPALPESKVMAFESLRMEPGLKILLKFSKKFWLSSHSLVVCSDCFVSQFWTYPAVSDCNVIMGFAAGDQARNIGQLTAEVMVDSFLKQLDAIYASHANGVNPATANYQDYHVFDWTKQSFIRGAYTSPSIGSSVIHRQLLGQSVSGYLFFAGEAASVYAPSTVVGAMESAAAAVEELIRLKQQKKTLLLKKKSKQLSTSLTAPAAGPITADVVINSKL